jgi:hypothetical protein
MLKTNQLILLGVVFLLGMYVFFVQKEHLTVNKDASKNWDVPELSSVPEPTPEAKDVMSLKKRVESLESTVADLKTKVH